MKMLVFNEGTFGRYEVSLEPKTLGQIIRHGETHFRLPNPTWVIVGFGQDFRSRRIDYPIAAVAENPKLAEGRTIWDRDHGTLRLHGGGGDHKAHHVYIEEV